LEFTALWVNPVGGESPRPLTAGKQKVLCQISLNLLSIQAFALVLLKRAYQAVKTNDLDEMKLTDT
jgi:hypothetical protein